MKNRLVRLLIWVLALSAMASSVWVLTHLPAPPESQFRRPINNLIILFSDGMLAAVPQLFPVAMWTYGVAIVLASVLALLVIAGAGNVRPALMMGGALSGLAFFAAHFLFVHRIEPLRGTLWVMAGDYVGMVAAAFGLWAAMRVALTHPEPVDVEAYIAACLKASRPTSKSARWLYRRSGLERANERMTQADPFLNAMRRRLFTDIQRLHWPAGIALVLMLVVAASHSWGLRVWMWLAVPLAFYPTLLMVGLAYGVLDWQYRTGLERGNARYAWLMLAGTIALWLIFLPQVAAWAMAIFGDHAELAYHVFLFTVNLQAPLMASVVVVLLACSVFFYGAINPRLAIRKTSVYGVAALLLAITMAVVQGTAATQLVQRFGLPSGAGPVVAMAVVGLVFAPLRHRIERGVERVVERVLPASTLAEAHRETVTVVFADMTGYTELSVRDETTALTLASLLHKESRRQAERHGGRLVKTIGDAVLLAFHDPGEAVVACAELREKFAAAAGGLKLAGLPLHFGMHTGEVVRDQEGDIFGGTVNLASRLQGIAAAGEIVASESVVAALPKGAFTIEAMGAQRLKNVPEPVPAFRVG